MNAVFMIALHLGHVKLKEILLTARKLLTAVHFSTHSFRISIHVYVL